MTSSSKVLAAFGLSALLGAAALLGSLTIANAADKPQPSKAAAKPLKAAQDMLQAKPPQYAEALVKLKEVEALPGKTPYDDYLMNELEGFAYARTSDFANAAKAYEAGLNSGFLDAAEVPNRVRLLATANYQVKNWDKAIEFGNRAIKEGYDKDGDMYTFVSQAYYLKGDYKNAQKFTDDYIESQIKDGKTPKEDTIKLELSACTKSDDMACQTKQFERLVSYYPKTEYWQNLLLVVLQSPGQNDKSLLHTYRLMAATDSMTRGDQYMEMAQLAMEQGSPGEAEAILQKGVEKNVFTDQRSQERSKRLLDSAKQQAVTDKASLAKVDSDAAASKTGAKDVGVGLAYLSYQNYDKAVAALQRGLAKPGVPNEADARLLLGIAELGAGKKDDAQQAFKAVKGDPTLERLANLWSLHARQA
jgi:hypothetical protein